MSKTKKVLYWTAGLAVGSLAALAIYDRRDKIKSCALNTTDWIKGKFNKTAKVEANS